MNKKIYIREAQKVSFKRKMNYLFDDICSHAFIVEYDGRYFDLLTAEEYKLVEYSKQNGAYVIMNDIFENTFYVRNIQPYAWADDESFNQAIEIIKYNEYLDELKRQKKLIAFPQRKIN